MRITLASHTDLENILSIYEQARDFMIRSSNPDQWIDGYPTKELLERDIELEQLYICLDNEDEIVAVFCFVIGEDPTYLKIYNGEWLNDEIYGAVHRMASTAKIKRISDFCFAYCLNQINNIRVDTHEANLPMQNVLKRCGYTKVGTIICSNGTPRIAYQITKKS